MKRLPLPLLVTLLAVLTFIAASGHSADDPFDVGAVVDSDLSSAEQLALEVELGEQQLLAWINEHGPEVARHDYILDRMIELRNMQGELEHEVDMVQSSAIREEERAAIEAEAVSDLQNLRRQAVELAEVQVTILQEELERARLLAAEGVVSLAEQTSIETQMQAARIALIEQQVALAEIALRDPGDELSDLQNVLQQYVTRIHHIDEQLNQLSELLEPSLEYRAIEQKLERQREALAAWELDQLSPHDEN